MLPYCILVNLFIYLQGIATTAFIYKKQCDQLPLLPFPDKFQQKVKYYTGMHWEIPDHWSLQEAATVPVAYATAYLALIIRGNLQYGEKVLIHTGASTVGIAAITIALHHGCEVYTTVGSDKKRDFLKERFPQLKDHHFASSRDLCFKEHIFEMTENAGVDIVVNNLSDEKLLASLECLGKGGRFLEIGKYDLTKDTPLGMLTFKHQVGKQIKPAH
mgnify:CR=1 FL=1